MNEDNRLAEVKRGVNSFVDTLDHSGIAEKNQSWLYWVF